MTPKSTQLQKVIDELETRYLETEIDRKREVELNRKLKKAIRKIKTPEVPS